MKVIDEVTVERRGSNVKALITYTDLPDTKLYHDISCKYVKSDRNGVNVRKAIINDFEIKKDGVLVEFTPISEKAKVNKQIFT